MAEKNLYINRFLSDPVYFADLVNGVRRGVERHRDVTMKAGDGAKACTSYWGWRMKGRGKACAVWRSISRITG